MSNYNYYGRRVVKVIKDDKIIHVLSGQWVGHDYGDPSGTGSDKQRLLLLKQCGASRILSVSLNIHWNVKGCSGDILPDDSPLVLKSKFHPLFKLSTQSIP